MMSAEQEIFDSLSPEGRDLLARALMLEKDNIQIGRSVKESTDAVYDMVKGYFQ